MRILAIGRFGWRLFLCALFVSIPSCGKPGTGIVDETWWETTERLTDVDRLGITITFADQFPHAHRAFAKQSLTKCLAARGFTLSDEARHSLLAHFLGLWTGSRGLPVSTRYAKVRVAVSLTDQESEKTLLKGQIDGVVDEGDVSFLDVAKSRRIKRAIDSAIGKLGRRLSALRTAPQEEGGEKPFVFPSVPFEKRETLAVIDFKSGEKVASGLGRALANICRNAVGTTGQYRLLDRANMQSILGEQDFAAVLKCKETKCLVEYGRMLHAKRMIHGSVSRLGEGHMLYMELIDVNTSEIDATATVNIGPRVEAFVDLVPAKTRELIASAIKLRGKKE